VKSRLHRELQSGFSLLELLTAVAVLGILATLTVPMAGWFRARSQGLKCAANLKGLGLGVSAYMQDNENRWPQIALSSSETIGKTDDPSQTAGSQKWIAALAPYGIAENTWRCPTVEANIKTHGRPEAIRMKRIDYMPTPFGSEPGSARQWPTHPWFIERSPNHGLGPKILLTSGRVVDMEELLRELPVQ
jgi:prepilin-type N-terminal cleavage/methylation domain-containing protein